jgi:hypothetical protein
VLGINSAHVFPILRQAAISVWHRRGHRLDAAFIRLETPVAKGTGLKDRDCMIGAISNWPISMPDSSTTQMLVY